MSRETAWLVRLSPAGAEQLLDDITAAAKRVPLALPGDRTDIVRFERLATELERMAMVAYTAGADAVRRGDPGRAGPASAFYAMDDEHLLGADVQDVAHWLAAGDIAVELRLTFGPGVTEALSQGRVRGPAEVWRAFDDRGDELSGSLAVEMRFRAQIQAALDGTDEDAAILPSGINNRALTNGLRAYVARDAGPVRMLPVVYEDGSKGPSFPLRSLSLKGGGLPAEWPRYRFAMLSIRHTEADSEVHGAWLRNAEISQPRQMGETDQLAYNQSLEQFARLTDRRPAIVYMFQTGLEAALLGVYRAAAQHMLERPGRLAVVPMFYRSPRKADADENAYVTKATYLEGQAWRA